MSDGKIPGVSVVIVNGDKTVYSKGFGYADIDTKKSVTSKTLFELGSNSKAFTALAILNLRKEGRINLNDPVKKYIPWFKMRYKGQYKGKKIDEYVDITLNQLLHHTSGIPFKSIGDIPIDDGDDALEKTVRTQVGKELDYYPGEKYLYATINYDVLGLVIEKVSGNSFEQYIKDDILDPLGLEHTYLFRNEFNQDDIATGYKLKFLRTVEYNAPKYRGNKPAGYFITNTEDLARWIKIQLGSQEYDNFDKGLIELSHIPDRTVAPSAIGASYACGWSVIQDSRGRIVHGGSNPNYSSYILLRTQEGLGVGVLANLNSLYTETIGNGIEEIIEGEKPSTKSSDVYISIDNAAFVVVLISFPVMLITIFLLIMLIIQLAKRERKFSGKFNGVICNISLMVLFILGLGYCMYKIPDVLYSNLSWSDPFSLKRTLQS